MVQNDKEVIGLKSFIVKYLLHWKMFVIAFLIATVLAILYLVLYPRTYVMNARILILEDRGGSASSGFGLGESAGLMKSFGLGGIGGGTVNIEDELKILRSNNMFRLMIRELGVNVDYTKPFSFIRLYEDTPFILKADLTTEELLDETVEMTVELKGGKIQVKSEANKGDVSLEFTSLPAVLNLPQGAFVLSYANPEEKLRDGTKIDIAYRPISHAAESLIKEFMIEEYSKAASIVELSCSDYNKKRGVDMLNALIKHYNEEAKSHKKKELQKSVVFLDDRIDTVMRNLQEAELEIERYKNANKLTNIEIDVQFYVEQMKDIQQRIVDF